MDDRIKFRHLQCFLAVARHGSLHKGAAALSITQPAVSKTLKELEALLAVRLVDRGRRGAVLTASGEAFHRHAEASVAALRDAVASVAEQDPVRTVVSLGVLPTVAPRLMPALLQQLDRSSVDQAHAISLRIHTGANPALLTQLRQGELDLVIGRFAEPVHMRGLTFEHLYADPLALVVRPAHPLRQTAESVRQLAGCTLVLPLPGTVIRQASDNFLQRHSWGTPQRSLETLDIGTAHRYTLDSDAVWLTPRGAVAHALADGSLVALDVDMRGTEELVGLSVRAEGSPTPAVAEVLQALRAITANQP